LLLKDDVIFSEANYLKTTIYDGAEINLESWGSSVQPFEQWDEITKDAIRNLISEKLTNIYIKVD
jgi:hypothetical protein